MVATMDQVYQRAVSYHESGHAICAVAVGYTLTEAWINENHGGRVSVAEQRDLRDFLAAVVAGRMCERSRCGFNASAFDEPSPGGAMTDGEQVVDLLTKLNGGYRPSLEHSTELREAEDRARGILIQYRDAVEAVALKLRENGSVTDSEVREAMGLEPASSPPPAPARQPERKRRPRSSVTPTPQGERDHVDPKSLGRYVLDIYYGDFDEWYAAEGSLFCASRSAAAAAWKERVASLLDPADVPYSKEDVMRLAGQLEGAA